MHDSAPNFKLAAGLACSALLSFGFLQTAVANPPQPPAILGPIELDRCEDGSCVIEFLAEPENDYTIYVSTDLYNWQPLGFFVEVEPGRFEYVDGDSQNNSSRYYQVEIHVPEPQPQPLPPQFEQLRQELGDEAFAEWLESNMEQTGTLSGIPEDQVNEMGPAELEQFEQMEQALQQWLEDFHAQNNPPEEEPVIILPIYNGTYQAMGGDDFSNLLLENYDQWGNFQGICPQALQDMNNFYPELYLEFQDAEQQLQDILNSGLVLPDPPQNDPPQLPPHLEELRQQLGDQAFAEWLQSNMTMWGNYQGLSQQAISDLQQNFPQQYQEFQQVEQLLQQWLDAMN